MRTVDKLFIEYGESHQNPTNKLFHWVCIPLIMFSLFGLLRAIPFPFDIHPWVNWASIIMVLALLYYIRLSIPLFIGFAVIAFFIIWGNQLLWEKFGNAKLAYISLAIFFLAWVGQFIGHKIEGKKPSFLKDLQFLFIGPAWLLHFIYNKLNIKH